MQAVLPKPAPDSSSGISPQERQELAAEIEKAVARAPGTGERIAADYRPRRSGIAFPLVLNAAAVVVVALAAVGLPIYFNRQSVTLTGAGGAALSGESSMVGALKREAESSLKTKDEEIGKIRDTLERASQELGAAKSQAAAALDRKAQELQADFDARLAAERTRLQGTGASAAAVDRQLAAMRQELQASQAEQLAAYRRQVDADLAKKQAALDAGLAESRRSLAQAEAEKAQLQAQAESSAKAASTAQGEKDLLAARLDALTAQNQREQLALDQITSSYAAVAAAVRGSRLDDARAALSSLAAFLDQPAVAALAAVRNRKAVDRFLIESLSQQVADRAAATAASPGASAEAAAAPALSDEQAAALGRLAAFSQALGGGDALYQAGNAAAAMDRYAAALSLLKEDAPGSARLAARIADAGFRQGQADLLTRSDRAARPVVESADEMAKRGSYSDAAAAYEKVIRSWPASSYVPRAVTGIQSSMDRLLRQARDADAAAAQQAADQAALARKTAAGALLDGAAAALVSSGRSSDAAGAAAQKELISLLDAKVKVKSVLGSEAVRNRYPGLSDSLDRYVQLFGQQKWEAGRAAGVQDSVAVLDFLLGRKDKDGLAQVLGRYADSAGRASLQQLLDRLRLFYP